MQKTQTLINNVKILQIFLSDINNIISIEKELGLGITPYNFFKNSIKINNIKNLKLVLNSIIVGYVSYQNIMKDCDIISIGIKKKFQRLGFGKKIIDFLISSNFKNIYVEVSNENVDAINFYKNQGFFLVGSRKMYYTVSKTDALIMKLTV